jgi:hypothetical protein
MTAAQADLVGKAWVGADAVWSSDGTALISKDLLRQYRPGTYKPKQGITQANLEWRLEKGGQWQGNAHIDVILK